MQRKAPYHPTNQYDDVYLNSSDSDDEYDYQFSRNSHQSYHMSATAGAMRSTRRSSRERKPQTKIQLPSQIRKTTGDHTSHKQPFEKQEMLKQSQKQQGLTTEKLQKDSRAIMMITAGPTGGGKQGLIEETFKHVMSEIPDYKMFLVDDLVESDPAYKEMVDGILKTNSCEYPFEGKDNAQCDLTNPSEALIAAFKTAYFAVRNKSGCMSNADNLNCNELNDRNLIRALKNHENVVIETTGSYIPTWILDLEFSNYKIVFAYTIVQFEVLLQRNASRARKQIAEYVKDRTKPGPRLIDIRPSVFLPIVNQIYNTLLDLRGECLSSNSPTSDKCKSKSSVLNTSTVHNLLLFDNSGPKMRNIYDHQNKQHADLTQWQFQALVLRAFFGPQF